MTFQHKTPTFTGSFFGTVTYPISGTYHQPAQKHYQMVTVHRGDLDVRLDGVLQPVGEGRSFFMVPGRRYDLYFSSTQETWHTWINYTDLQLTAALKSRLESAPLRVRLGRKLGAILDTLLVYRNHYAEADAEVTRMLCGAALMAWLRDAEMALPHAKPVHPAVGQARQFIQENLPNPLDLRVIAEHAHVSPEHLVRIFREALTHTPMKYVWRERVRRAVELLRGSGLTVAEVAYQCGFSSPYHFSRKVREVTGLSPTEIRQVDRV